MSERVEVKIQCSACKGTGLYQGMAEGGGTAVVCTQCKGEGAVQYSYTPFVGLQPAIGIERVYLRGSQYKIGLGKVTYKDIGTIDMDKEGVSYREFLSGILPKHIRQLGCPMSLDQGACHSVKGFVDGCNDLNGGYIGFIPGCTNQRNAAECWKRFDKEKN